MDSSTWYKQTTEKPLFPDLLWSRPENKRTAGKLLIIGGNAQTFAAPAAAYTEAVNAGAGAVRILLPDAVKKVVGNMLENGEFAPCTPSGSFSQKALSEFLEHASWADGIVIAGDLGRNSETGILMENFLRKTNVSVTLTKDAADYALGIPDVILSRPNTVMVLTMAQLQKLGIAARLPQAITFSMDLVRLVESLHEITTTYSMSIVVKHLLNILCAENGRISTTKLATDTETWRIKTASYASVWQLQNPSKPFEAITTAVAEAWGLS